MTISKLGAVSWDGLGRALQDTLRANGVMQYRLFAKIGSKVLESCDFLCRDSPLIVLAFCVEKQARLCRPPSLHSLRVFLK